MSDVYGMTVQERRMAEKMSDLKKKQKVYRDKYIECDIVLSFLREKMRKLFERRGQDFYKFEALQRKKLVNRMKTNALKVANEKKKRGY
jgi:hypothetical protein